MANHIWSLSKFIEQHWPFSSSKTRLSLQNFVYIATVLLPIWFPILSFVCAFVDSSLEILAAGEVWHYSNTITEAMSWLLFNRLQTEWTARLAKNASREFQLKFKPNQIYFNHLQMINWSTFASPILAESYSHRSQTSQSFIWTGLWLLLEESLSKHLWSNIKLAATWT